MSRNIAAPRASAAALRHAEKLGLGAASLLVLAGLVAGTRGPGPEALVLAADSAALRTEFDRAHDTLTPPPRRRPEPPPPPIDDIWPPDPWMGTWPTRFMITGIVPPPPPEGPPVALVTLRVTEVASDAVTLTWTVDAKGPAPDQFILQRRRGSDAWEVVTRLDAKTAAHRDDRLEPKAVYEYRLIAASRRSGVPARESNVVRAETPGLVSVRLFQVGADEACFILERRHPAFGVVSVMTRHKRGETIGGERIVSIRARRVRLDFSTGWTLRGIEKVTRGERRVCVPDPGGPGCLEEVRGDLPIEAWKVTCVDEAGRERALWTRDPSPADHRCKEHRGR